MCDNLWGEPEPAYYIYLVIAKKVMSCSLIDLPTFLSLIQQSNAEPGNFVERC